MSTRGGAFLTTFIREEEAIILDRKKYSSLAVRGDVSQTVHLSMSYL